jgi:hypothetical protein
MSLQNKLERHSDFQYATNSDAEISILIPEKQATPRKILHSGSISRRWQINLASI